MSSKMKTRQVYTKPLLIASRWGYLPGIMAPWGFWL